MKKALITSLIILSCFTSFAQDIIVKNDKTEIKAKIEELTETSIKYKKIEMLDGPSYNINKRDVFMIIYKNGTKEYIEPTAVQPVATSPQAQPQLVQENRQPANNQSGNNSTINSQNNTIPSTAALIEAKGHRYYYKGESIMSYKAMTHIFEDNHAQESINYMRKRRTQWIACATLGAASLVLTAVSGGYSGKGVKNRPLSLAGTGCFIIGAVFGILSVTQPKKAVAAYNNMINNGKRTSFVPTFNSDAMGNHIGIAMRF